MKKSLVFILSACMMIGNVSAVFAGETAANGDASDASAVSDEIHVISLSSEESDGSYTHSASIDGNAVEEYDYTWHADPSEVHDDVKNSPAEYYTGTEPDTDAAAYIAHDIYYYPELDESAFKQVSYDGDTEWAYYYNDGTNNDYIFATLPVQGSSVPTQMMHSEEEAYDNAVLHITEPGTYKLTGTWHGQIWIDLGDQDDTASDENAKVNLILGGADVTCTVAPSTVFYSVYECDNGWEDRTSYSSDVDTSNAGANVIIEDGTENNFSGTNVYRMLKTKYKDSDSTDSSSVPLQKKARKTDAAFYSYESMNIEGGEKGDGVLNVTGGYEGLDTELHLTVNSGNINIFSQDDGMNVNEDGVSVVTFNGGSTHILAGLGSEGDGVDSNGYAVVNGGTLISMASPQSDSGLDSDCGTYVNGGTVVALGSTMDYAKSSDTSDKGQAVMNLRFSSQQNADEAIIVTDTDGKAVFAYDPDKDEVAGTQTRTYQGAIISSANIEVGKDYNVYVGGNVTGEETEGVYDADTITGFENAVQQCYTGTESLDNGNVPAGGDGTTPPEQPSGDQNGTDGTTPPEQPSGDQSGTDGTTPPEQPSGDQSGTDGTTPPEQPSGDQSGTDGTTPPEIPDGSTGDMQGNPGGAPGENQDLSNASIVFTMSEKVNSFSGVTDYTGGSGSTGFTDVSDSDWFSEDVAYAVENKLMNGTSSTTFSPNETTTRGMIVTILYRLEGQPDSSSENAFSDVAEGSYYEKAVAWANENGIVTGYGDGKFGPEDNITREQLAAILYRYANYKKYDTDTSADLSKYADADQISSYAVEAMKWANGTGLITGTSDTTLSPEGTALRCQTAAVFHRLLENIVQ